MNKLSMKRILEKAFLKVSYGKFQKKSFVKLISLSIIKEKFVTFSYPDMHVMRKSNLLTQFSIDGVCIKCNFLSLTVPVLYMLQGKLWQIKRIN